MTQADTYRVFLDNEWTLNDLHVFAHNLNQAYAFSYCFDTDLPTQDIERIDAALQKYPWVGGYDIVNIYKVLQNQVPPEYQPKIVSIKYSSPGWLDFLANPDAILHVAHCVYRLIADAPTGIQALTGIPVAAKAIASTFTSAEKILASYENIEKMLRERRHAKRRDEIEGIELDTNYSRTLQARADEFSRLIGFNGFQQLLARTGGNVETAAKLVLAQCRRLEHIAEYVRRGQASCLAYEQFTMSKSMGPVYLLFAAAPALRRPTRAASLAAAKFPAEQLALHPSVKLWLPEA